MVILEAFRTEITAQVLEEDFQLEVVSEHHIQSKVILEDGFLLVVMARTTYGDLKQY